MKRKLISMAIVAAFSIPGAALAQQQSAEPQKSQQRADKRQNQQQKQAMAMLASDLIGKKVVNAEGKDLGEVQDLAIDINNNRVHYAMLDMQNEMFAYPMRTLGLTADGDKVLLNVSEERLEKAPGMDPSKWASRSDRVGAEYGDYWREADTFWRDNAPRGARADADKATRDGGPKVTVQPSQNMQLVWASKLIGWNVHNQANDDSIGEVKDLVLNPRDGSVRFAAVDFNDKIGGPNADALDDRLQPLPLTAFATRDGKDDLVLKADRAKLQPAQGIDEDQLDDKLADRSFIDKTERYVRSIGPTTVGSRG